MKREPDPDRLTAVVVDDEVGSADNISAKLALHCPQVRLLGVCHDPLQAIEQISALRPDVVFLDVEMPGMNGLEMLKRFEQIDFAVIFVTAHHAYAVEAFRLYALDYLLKPVAPALLADAVGRALERKQQQALTATAEQHWQAEALQNLVQQFPGETNSVWLKGLNGFVHQFQISHIQWFAADGDYAKMHWFDGQARKEVFVAESLRQLEAKLGAVRFFRANPSVLLNTQQIAAYRHADGTARLNNGEHAIVSQRRRSAFGEFIGLG